MDTGGPACTGVRISIGMANSSPETVIVIGIANDNKPGDTDKSGWGMLRVCALTSVW